MSDTWELVVASVAAVTASSGFWAYVSAHKAKDNALSKLLMGLAYDKITEIGLRYIDRGWVSKDEYEEFLKYLYEPYKNMGGNGVAERIKNAVSSLPIHSAPFSGTPIPPDSGQGHQ